MFRNHPLIASHPPLCMYEKCLVAHLFVGALIRNLTVFLLLMEITINATISDNITAAIQNGSATPLPRRLLELAAIRQSKADDRRLLCYSR